MTQSLDGPFLAAKAGGAIAQYLLVKAPITALVVAGLADEPLGFIDRDVFAAGDVCNVVLLSKEGTAIAIAGAAITAGAAVYGRAAGKIDDDSATGAIRVGTAIVAAAADGDQVEVMLRG